MRQRAASMAANTRHMLHFILTRIARTVLTVLGVFTAAFLLVRAHGDPAVLLLSEGATPQQLAELRSELGLDQPMWVQYGRFLGNALRGDFGDSLRQHTSALGLVLDRLPATLELAMASFVLGLALAFAGGLWMQLTPHRRLRSILLWLAFVRQAIPAFWFGLLLILVFSVQLRWLPSLGRGTVLHLVLPALTLATYELALYLRLLDSAFREEQGRDYIRTAYAKGLGHPAVTLRHALPNVLLPLVTIAGINLGVLLGGTVVTEIVFSWPGIGRLIVQSVQQRDYPVVVAGVVVASLVFVTVNLAVDLLYTRLDPRVGSA